ncbi:protein of unknown function [Acidithiobacillus ferrivorans]|uniref:Transposase n=1 Tax=Acidithiobacillus ferrivorans TaxID=160808 RepID=A0ABY1MUE8_9PROT|nr:protein of unknown function [Acidithiobacillus ferrivorans]
MGDDKIRMRKAIPAAIKDHLRTVACWNGDCLVTVFGLADFKCSDP